MKRNILILFFIIGLVGLEYGCKHESTSDSQNAETCDKSAFMSVTGIMSEPSVLSADSVSFYEVEEGDSVNYKKLLIRLFCKAEFVQLDKSFASSSAYAIRAEVEPVCWDIKSIKIEGVTATETRDLTPYFNLSPNYTGAYSFPITNDDMFRDEVQKNIVGTPVLLSLTMREAPSMVQEMALRIKFENTDGRSFEFTTVPLVITY
jgi:hypothetical protein